MKQVDFLVKPASSQCNMRCRYCFYEDEAAHRKVASMGVMQPATSEALIDAALQAADFDGQISFAFQGGEPTVAGLDFYRHFVAEVNARNQKHIPVTYAMQTNGLAITPAWAAFLAEHRFLVGLSLDGDKALHDEFRLDAAGKGTYNRVLRALDLLQRAGVAVNLLCVVTKRCAKSAVRVYHALQKTGVRYLQFIPCLDPLGEARGSMPWSLLPQDYGSFLCALFDEWYRDFTAGRYTSVRLFDDYVHLAMGLPSGSCATAGRCGSYFVIEADGGVYPCDFYVLDDRRIGQIGQTPLTDLAGSRLARQFLEESLTHPEPCAACPWYTLCNGGCKRDWTDADGTRQNYYCGAFRRFFEHAAPRLQELAQRELRYRAPQTNGFIR